MQRPTTIRQFLDASAAGDLATVKNFLQSTHPFDVFTDIRDSQRENKTALMLAAMQGHESVVNEIIQCMKQYNLSHQKEHIEFDLNAIDNLHMNALMYAAAAGHQKICSILIENGTDPRNCDSKQTSPAEFAKEHAHHNLAAYLHLKAAEKNAERKTLDSQRIFRLYATPTITPTPEPDSKMLTRSATKKRRVLKK